MRLVVNGKIPAFLLQAGRSRNKKNTSFSLIRQHLQKKVILEMFIAAPAEYFTAKSDQEMDLASVIAMTFMC